MRRYMISCLIFIIFMSIFCIEALAGLNMGFKGGIYYPREDRLNLKNTDDTGLNFEVFLGYRIIPLFEIEFGIGAYSTDWKLQAGSHRWESEVRSTPFYATGKIVADLGDLISLFGGAGIGYHFTRVNYKYTYHGDLFEINESKNALGFHIVGGMDFNIGDAIALGLEGKWIEVEPKYSEEKVAFGGFMANLVFKYRF